MPSRSATASPSSRSTCPWLSANAACATSAWRAASAVRPSSCPSRRAIAARAAAISASREAAICGPEAGAEQVQVLGGGRWQGQGPRRGAPPQVRERAAGRQRTTAQVGAQRGPPHLLRARDIVLKGQKNGGVLRGCPARQSLKGLLQRRRAGAAAQERGGAAQQPVACEQRRQRGRAHRRGGVDAWRQRVAHWARELGDGDLKLAAHQLGREPLAGRSRLGTCLAATCLGKAEGGGTMQGGRIPGRARRATAVREARTQRPHSAGRRRWRTLPRQLSEAPRAAAADGPVNGQALAPALPWALSGVWPRGNGAKPAREVALRPTAPTAGRQCLMSMLMGGLSTDDQRDAEWLGGSTDDQRDGVQIDRIEL